MRSTLQHDKVIESSKTKVHVYSDSVLCLGKRHGHPEAMVMWKDQLEYFQKSSEYRIIWNRLRTSWVRVEHFPRTHCSADSPSDSGQNGSLSSKSRRIWRSNHLHVFVQRHRLDLEWNLQQKCFFEFWHGKRLRKEISVGTLVFFLGSGEEAKMIWNAKLQTWRTVEFYCRCHGCQCPRQRTSLLQSFQCVGSWILWVVALIWMLQQFGGNLLSAVAFSSLLEWQVCADECRMRIWCSCSRLHVSCNSCCHSWVWVHVRQYHPVIRSSPKNDHRQHCHVGNAGPALSTGLIPRLRLCWRGHTMWKDMLKDHDIQFEESGHPVYRASSASDRGFLKDSWTRKVGDVRFTSVRILRTQSFSFAQFILQISSVSTEQSRIVVMKWLSRFLGSHFQAWSHPSRMSEQLCRKIGGSEYVQMRRVIKQRLIDCAFISDLWIGGIHEESLSWMLPNNSDVNHGFGGTTRSCREYTLTTSRKWTSTKLTEQFVWFRTWRCPNIRRFSMAGSYLQRMQPLVCSHHPKVTRKGSRRQGAHAWCFRCVLFFRHVVVSCFPAGTNIWNWMGKSSELGVPCCSSKTRIILIRTCGWH